jgi:hypothetical protein
MASCCKRVKLFHHTGPAGVPWMISFQTSSVDKKRRKTPLVGRDRNKSFFYGI